MNRKVSISCRWYGPIPHRNGKPLPKNQWARAGRKRRWTVRWFAPDGSRPRQTFESKADAEAYARELIGKADYAPAGDKFRKVIDIYHQACREFGAEPMELD